MSSDTIVFLVFIPNYFVKNNIDKVSRRSINVCERSSIGSPLLLLKPLTLIFPTPHETYNLTITVAIFQTDPQTFLVKLGEVDLL